jgi:hypothetical protein
VQRVARTAAHPGLVARSRRGVALTGECVRPAQERLPEVVARERGELGDPLALRRAGERQRRPGAVADGEGVEDGEADWQHEAQAEPVGLGDQQHAVGGTFGVRQPRHRVETRAQRAHLLLARPHGGQAVGG